MKPLLISVRGFRSVPWGSSNNEWKWRRRLADEASKKQSQAPVIIPRPASYHVEVTFYLMRSMNQGDLDNLAKPVLDSLSRTEHPQVKDLGLTGALFDVADRFVD